MGPHELSYDPLWCYTLQEGLVYIPKEEILTPNSILLNATPESRSYICQPKTCSTYTHGDFMRLILNKHWFKDESFNSTKAYWYIHFMKLNRQVYPMYYNMRYNNACKSFLSRPKFLMKMHIKKIMAEHRHTMTLLSRQTIIPLRVSMYKLF